MIYSNQNNKSLQTIRRNNLMAGLFGWFSRKNNQAQVQDSYFLNPDESKTFGNIDYMRKTKTVKRTFAKSISGGGGELVKEVSALKMTKKNSNQTGFNSSSTTSSETSESNSSFTPDSQRLRKTDTTMDTFRNMAKQIKK
ncbi:hypothetical protein [Geminocystis sp. NIES-3709]|uniref:hypothetical protein n=1 Tax=Geminocystis sp. NIES-3709 TaxID=1617448 RepID=UPI0005FCA198|nr:hypothetical protein [Geminocystis sp. NIES-3709]BAQ65176.1 hypothetical protein GM3709_1941 [Geminocystis sp. NIES-3709]